VVGMIRGQQNCSFFFIETHGSGHK
jgi:hypothetical protein